MCGGLERIGHVVSGQTAGEDGRTSREKAVPCSRVVIAQGNRRSNLDMVHAVSLSLVTEVVTVLGTEDDCCFWARL